MNKNLIKLLKDLCLIPGLSGYEDKVRSYIRNELSNAGISSKSDVLRHQPTLCFLGLVILIS